MKLSEALEKVSAAYVPGVADYFAGHRPDPWMEAHFDLDRVMQLKDLKMNEDAADAFVESCLEMIARFKRESSPPKKMTAWEGGRIGEVERFKQRWSVAHKTCASCGGKENLTIQSVGPEALQVQVICRACAKGAA